MQRPFVSIFIAIQNITKTISLYSPSISKTNYSSQNYAKKIAVLSTIITDYNLNFPTNLKRIKTPFPLSIRIEIPKVSSFYRKTQNPSKQVVQDYHKIIKLGIINVNLLIISRFKKKTLIKISPWQFGKQW